MYSISSDIFLLVRNATMSLSMFSIGIIVKDSRVTDMLSKYRGCYLASISWILVT